MNTAVDSSYLPIDGSTVTLETLKSFDLHCALDGRIALYMGANAELSDAIRARQDEIDTATLYVHKKDIIQYNAYLEEVLGTILNHPGIDLTVKARAVFAALGTLGKQVFAIPEEKHLKRYKMVAAEVSAFILNNDNGYRALSRMMDSTYSMSNHAINVGVTSMALAKKILGNNPKYNYGEIGPGFFLHDIGNASVPVEVLNKKGPLSAVEWRLIRRHPQEGLRILSHVNMLSNEAKIIIAQHHERHNGSGYPKALTGDSIHVLGKICSIADCFDSLTCQRPYRDKRPTFTALKIMKQEMFKDFDPAFFQAFVLLLS